MEIITNNTSNRNTLLSKYFLQIAEKTILVFLALCLFFFKDNLLLNIDSGYLLLKIGIGINIYLILKSRKIKPVAIFFVFALTYQLNLIAYYRDLEDISGGHNLYDKIIYYNNTEWIQVLFLLSIAIFFPLIRKSYFLKNKLSAEPSKFFYWITFFFMSYIAIFGISGGNIFEIGGYGKEAAEGAGGTAIFEYFLVLVPLIYFFAGKDKPLRMLATFIILVFAIKGLSMGIRNNVLQLGLLLFALNDNPKIKYWHIITVSIIPVYLLLVYGAIRINPLILFSNNLSDVLLEPINNFGFGLLGNQNDIFYASVRIYGFLQEGIISAGDRIVIAISNLTAIVVPYSFLPEIANIAAYKQKEYGSSGGSLISMYWYVFAGVPGVIFIGWYISFLIRTFIKSDNKYFLIYFLLVLSTYPRWFGYNQISLFKISVYGVLYYLVLILMKKIIQLNKKPQIV